MDFLNSLIPVAQAQTEPLIQRGFFRILPQANECFSSAQTGNQVTPDFLPCYFNELFTFAVQAAIVFAIMMIMVGGFRWLMAYGNQAQISDAKQIISGAFIGLILALTSNLLLAQINSNLVNLKIDYVERVDLNPVVTDTTCGPQAEIELSKLNNFINGGIESAQLSFAHPDLVRALTGLNDTLNGEVAQSPSVFGGIQVRITSVIDDSVLNGSCSADAFGNLQGTCSHSQNSAHYGGGNYKCSFNKDNPPISCAVDLVPTAANELTYSILRGFAKNYFSYAICEGGGRAIDSCDGPTDHIHASVSACGAN